MARMTLPGEISLAQKIACGAALALAVVAAAWVYAHGTPSWNPESLRDRIGEAGLLAPFLFVVIVACRPILLLPSWIAHASGGLLFGAMAGTILGTLGTSLGAVIAFGTSRSLGRHAVETRYNRILRIDHLQRRGSGWLAATTALPFTPLTPIYCAAGLSGMRLTPFTLASVVGLLPRVGLFSYLGALSVEPTRSHLAIASMVVLGGVLATVVRRAVEPTLTGGGDTGQLETSESFVNVPGAPSPEGKGSCHDFEN